MSVGRGYCRDDTGANPWAFSSSCADLATCQELCGNQCAGLSWSSNPEDNHDTCQENGLARCVIHQGASVATQSSSHKQEYTCYGIQMCRCADVQKRWDECADADNEDKCADLDCEWRGSWDTGCCKPKGVGTTESRTLGRGMSQTHETKCVPPRGVDRAAPTKLPLAVFANILACVLLI